MTRGILLCWVGATMTAAIPATAQTDGRSESATDALRAKAHAAIAKAETSLIELRRDIHRHPELSGNEERTAAVVADRLRALGLDVRTGVGGHGLIGVLRGAAPGPVVAYRADMDAIASTAPDPVDFVSETPGVRHGCGHDVHTTIAVGIATALASVRDDLPGTVVFIFQPAEETAEGAAAMIEDGALGDPRPEAILALHCAPLEVGQIAGSRGLILPGLDVIRVDLSGDGDLQAAARYCADVLSGVNVPPGTAGVGEFVLAAGERSRPDGSGGWTCVGIVRASSEARHAEARAGIEAGIDAMDVPGVSHRLTVTEYAVPPTLNDSSLVDRVNPALRAAIGDDNLIMIEETTPFFSEDFSHFQREIPGAMYFLGVSNAAKGINGMPHDPSFAVDEAAIAVGARAMTDAILTIAVGE